jgi:hypothetical protein
MKSAMPSRLLCVDTVKGREDSLGFSGAAQIMAAATGRVGDMQKELRAVR